MQHELTLNRRPMSLTNEEMALLVLPWARVNRPGPYGKTVAVSAVPATYRAYLVRLVELRWADEPAWRPEVPLRALEETALVQRVRHRPSGVEIEIEGRLDPATREPRTTPRRYGFGNVAEAVQAGVDFAFFTGVIKDLDLTVDE